MWGFLVASRCIFILIMTLLDHRNTATTKKLDFKNSHLTSVGATIWASAPPYGVRVEKANIIMGGTKHGLDAEYSHVPHLKNL
jgi:hypothetical protein